jgi:hypothetical protein
MMALEVRYWAAMRLITCGVYWAYNDMLMGCQNKHGNGLGKA